MRNSAWIVVLALMLPSGFGPGLAGRRAAVGDDRNAEVVVTGHRTWSGTPRAIELAPDPPPRAPELLIDTDNDTVDDSIDNCITEPNTDQADGDGDGVGDVCDNCPAEPNPRPALLDEDFEAEVVGWTHESLGEADTWHVNFFRCFDPFFLPSSMYFSNGNAGPACVPDSSYELSQLVSPPVTLPATTGAITLSFDALAYDEAGSCFASGDFDKKEVGISTDGGSTYTVLNSCFPLVPDGMQGDLVHHDLDISAFAGQTVQVVFAYDTVDTTGGDTFGVDNVLITSNGTPQDDADGDDVGDACDACPNDPGNDVDVDGICGDVDNCPAESNPPPAPTEEDFNSGGVGWSHFAVPPGADTWHLSSTTCEGNPLGGNWYVSNGNRGPGCVDDSSLEKSRLLSPPFVMPTNSATIYFEAVSFDEQGSCLASQDFDAKDVGITTDGGATYTVINDCFPITTVPGDVAIHEFDVSASEGFTFQLLFAYDTRDDEIDHTFAVDDIIISPHQRDSDSDGMGDVCDPCPDDALNDGDDDGWCAREDNCPTEPNGSQSNLDGDAFGDACDCLPLDGSAFASPQEVTGLQFSDRTTLIWASQEDTAGSGTVYDVMRGALGQFPVGSGGSETCIDPGSTDTVTVDLQLPDGESGFYYLVRGVNNCGTGTYGFDSTPVERTTSVCP